MCRILKFCCVCYLLATAPGCMKTTAPEVILEKAIAAHGGEANLTKHRVGRARGEDTGPRTRVTWEEVFDIPGRWIKRSDGNMNGRRFRQAMLFTDGTLSVSRDGGETEEAPAGNADPNGQIFGQVAMLVRFRQPDVKLSPLAEVRIGDRVAVGFRADTERPGEFYFDKESGLLQKIVGEWTSPRAVKATVTIVYGDYREVDGVKLPHRIATIIDGEPMGESVVRGVELLKEVDKGAFQLP